MGMGFKAFMALSPSSTRREESSGLGGTKGSMEQKISAIETSGGKFVIAGFHEVPVFGIFLAKLDSSGNVLWVKERAFTQICHLPYSLRETPEGDFLFSGSSNSEQSSLGRISSDGHGGSCGWVDMNYTTNTPIVNSSDYSVTHGSPGWTTQPWTPTTDENITPGTTIICDGVCPQYTYGKDCEVFRCGDGLSNTTLCSGNGTCTVPGGHCQCNQYFHGSDCTVFKCGNGLSNMTLCSEHGSCNVPGDHCHCDQYYYGPDCSVFECDGFLSNETVCYGRGTCDTVNGKCSCIMGYETEKCKDFKLPDDGVGHVRVLSSVLLILFCFLCVLL